MLEDTTRFPRFANDLRTASQPHAKDPEAHLQPQLPGRRTSLKGTKRTQHPALPPSTSEQAPSSLLNPTSSWARPRTVPRQHCGGRQPARPPARRRLRALTAYPGPLEWPGRGRGPGRPPARTAVQCVGRQARPGPARPGPKPGPSARHSPGPARPSPAGGAAATPGASRGRRRAEEAALGRTAQPPLRLSPSSSGPSSNRKYLAGNTAARRGTGRGQHLSRPRRACLWSFTRHAVAGATAGGNRLK